MQSTGIISAIVAQKLKTSGCQHTSPEIYSPNTTNELEYWLITSSVLSKNKNRPSRGQFKYDYNKICTLQQSKSMHFTAKCGTQHIFHILKKLSSCSKFKPRENPQQIWGTCGFHVRVISDVPEQDSLEKLLVSFCVAWPVLLYFLIQKVL